MKNNIIISLLLIILFTGCMQVPKKSVELSATVGRDIAVTHEAHIQLATLLFERMNADVNRFIDDTYAPYQIRTVMERQKQLADSIDKKVRSKSLLLAINAAFKPGASEKLQGNVLKGMGALVMKIRSDVENMRSELLSPLIEQEKQVLGSINRAYQKMHYANSIVTGHLSSIVKLHEVQSEVLSEIGIERDLRKEIGEGVAGVSEKISSLVNKAEKINSKMDSAESTAQSLKAAIEKLKQTINK